MAIPEDGMTPSQRDFQEVRPPTAKMLRRLRLSRGRMTVGHPYARPYLVAIDKPDESSESGPEEPSSDDDHLLPSRYEPGGIRGCGKKHPFHPLGKHSRPCC